MSLYYYFRRGLTCLLFIIVPAVIFYPVKTTAQQSSTLRVVIRSAESGKPLPGANVILLSTDGKEVIANGATNNFGVLEFSGLSSDIYTLKIKYIGFQTYKDKVTIPTGDIKVKIVKLEIATAELEELTVVGERQVAIGNAGIVTVLPGEISRVPAPVIGGDLASYLQSVPGIITPGDRGGQVYILGGAPWQTKVLVDDLPIYKPFHISNLFSAFPSTALQNVTLYEGGFGANYIDVTSAVIDVNLTPGNFKEFNGSATISPYLAALHIEGPLEKGKKSFLIVGRKSLYNNLGPYFSPDKINPINFYDITARYTFRSNSYTCNITGLRTFDQGLINPVLTKKLSWQNTVIGGRCFGYDETLDKYIKATLGYTYYKNSVGDNRSSSLGYKYITIDNAEDFFGLTFDYGLNVNFRTYSVNISDKFTNDQSYVKRVGSVGVYLSTVLDLNDYITLEPGIGSLATGHITPTFEPRLRILLRPTGTDKHEISLAAGQYSQIVSAISDVRNAGAFFTVLKPTAKQDKPIPSAIHGIMSYHLNLKNGFNANIQGYVKRFRHIQVPKWTPTATVSTETAPAEALAYGFNLYAEYSRRNIYLSLGYGYSIITYKALSKNLGAWVLGKVFSYHPPYDQRHKFNAILSYELADFTFNTRWEFGSGRPFTRVFAFQLLLRLPEEYPTEDPGTARTLFSRPYGGRLPVYHRLDISVKRTFEISPRTILKVQIGALNIYNRKNIFYLDSNTLTRVNQSSFFPYISIQTSF